MYGCSAQLVADPAVVGATSFTGNHHFCLAYLQLLLLFVLLLLLLLLLLLQEAV